MLPGELNLPEAIFALDGQDVNRLFDSLCKDADRKLAHQMDAIFQAQQVQWFQKLEVLCPACGSDYLIRKGWRDRKLKSSRGRLTLWVLQAKCKSCGRIFRPFTDLAGIPTSRRFLDEFVTKAIRLAIQMPYGRSSRVLKELTGGQISHEGIRQKVAQRAREITLATPTTSQTVLVDSTKVKAGSKKRGAPVHLAITAEPGPEVAGRKTIKKQLLHLHVGDVEPLRRRLRDLRPQRLVHDGGEPYSGCSEHIQRCNWHLVHQLRHYLWQDGLPLAERGYYQDCLRTILWDAKGGAANYATFIQDMKAFGFTSTARHLEGAQSEAFTWTEEKGFSFTTTSPLEREMRELNSRADVGARWSEHGVENVLKVRFHERLNNHLRGSTQPR